MNGRLLFRLPLAMLTVALVVGGFGAGAAPSARAQSIAVSISGFKFNPATLAVPVGTTVTWTNSDIAAHTATSDSSAWTTPLIRQGQSASVSFNEAGTFTYHCSVHPNMKATIIVQSASTRVPLSATLVKPVKVLAKEVNSKYVFGPTKTRIKVGQTVVWKNTTDAAHTVTSTTNGWKYDKKLNVGKSLRLTFKKAGTFHYKCSYHPGMVGTIIASH